MNSGDFPYYIRRQTLNRQVPGSIPGWRTKWTSLPQAIAGFCFYTVSAYWRPEH